MTQRSKIILNIILSYKAPLIVTGAIVTGATIFQMGTICRSIVTGPLIFQRGTIFRSIVTGPAIFQRGTIFRSIVTRAPIFQRGTIFRTIVTGAPYISEGYYYKAPSYRTYEQFNIDHSPRNNHVKSAMHH